MYYPTSHPWVEDETLGQHLSERGVSRRDFLEFCGSMCAVLGLTSSMLPKVAQALESVKRPTVVWLQLQECTGCVESVLRTAFERAIAGSDHDNRANDESLNSGLRKLLITIQDATPSKDDAE